MPRLAPFFFFLVGWVASIHNASSGEKGSKDKKPWITSTVYIVKESAKRQWS